MEENGGRCESWSVLLLKVMTQEKSGKGDSIVLGTRILWGEYGMEQFPWRRGRTADRQWGKKRRELATSLET